MPAQDSHQPVRVTPVFAENEPRLDVTHCRWWRTPISYLVCQRPFCWSANRVALVMPRCENHNHVLVFTTLSAALLIVGLENYADLLGRTRRVELIRAFETDRMVRESFGPRRPKQCLGISAEGSPISTIGDG